MGHQSDALAVEAGHAQRLAGGVEQPLTTALGEGDLLVRVRAEFVLAKLHERGVG